MRSSSPVVSGGGAERVQPPEVVSAISQSVLNALRAADASAEARGLPGRTLRDAVRASEGVRWPSGEFDDEAFDFVLSGLADGHLRLEARAPPPLPPPLSHHSLLSADFLARLRR